MDFMRSEYRLRGFQEVVTPNMYDSRLFLTSGHYQNYKAYSIRARNSPTGSIAKAIRTFKPWFERLGTFLFSLFCLFPFYNSSFGNRRELQKDDMYSLDVEKQEWMLKPMNCPGHFVMFDARVRSYKDPILV